LYADRTRSPDSNGVLNSNVNKNAHRIR